MGIEYLQWDSDFFGKKIGKITTCGSSVFENHLIKARAEGYDVIYVFGANNLRLDNSLLNEFNGRIVDVKVLYVKDITSSYENIEADIVEYTDNECCNDLEQLAYLSGEYSRYKTDDNFGVDNFKRLYKTWMDKSITREIADKLFIIKNNDEILGMVTMKIEAEIGHLGIMAVKENAQKNGYANSFIKYCCNTLYAIGINEIEVPTQLNNLKACRLYERLGFKIHDITSVYHFWLNK